MVELCNLCKLLANPLRLEMLGRVHLAVDGVNVSVLADDLSLSGIGQSGVSQYLKQLASAGVVRRVRAGRYVNYVRCDPPVSVVRKAVEAIVQRMRKSRDRDFAYIFNAGAISAAEMCERLDHQVKYLKRDLQCAVDAGILSVDDSDSQLAVYRYIEPSDVLVSQIVSLASDQLL